MQLRRNFSYIVFILYNRLVRYLTILYILGDYIMKNTVKLEQFKEVTELELQEIRGGEIRLPYIFKKLFSNNIK